VREPAQQRSDLALQDVGSSTRRGKLPGKKLREVSGYPSADMLDLEQVPQLAAQHGAPQCRLTGSHTSRASGSDRGGIRRTQP
jgi:hypothetical protein